MYAGMATFLPRPQDEPIVKESMKSVPVLMTHGAADFVVPLPLSRLGYRQLQWAGANIDHDVYLTMKHDLRDDMLDDVAKFMNSLL